MISPLAPEQVAQWIAGLKQVSGFDWTHRVDHKDRDEFRANVGEFELHIWTNGRWSIFDGGGNGLVSARRQDFQVALRQLGTEYMKRLKSTESEE